MTQNIIIGEKLDIGPSKFNLPEIHIYDENILIKESIDGIDPEKNE